MTVRRFDRGEIKKAEKTDAGFLRAPAFIARTGIYLYVDADGKITRELRRPEQVFHADALASFALSPVTDNHPPEGYVDATTATKYARGSIGEVVAQDGNMVRALMMITDAALVKKVLDGAAQEVSCGYTCDVLAGGGEYHGERYDTEQTNIRGNHVAIVPAGRAGPAARVKLDAGDAIALPAEHDPARSERDDNRQETPMKKTITINGQTFELDAHVVDAINAQRGRDASEAQARVDATAHTCDAKCHDGKCCPECGAECGEAKKCPECGAACSGAKSKKDTIAAFRARADALTVEVATLKKTATDAATASPKLVVDALEVVDVARRAGVEVKIDALDLAALRRAVAEKVNGVKLDGKDPAYVAASFDIAKAKIDDTATGAGLLAAVVPGTGEHREDADESSDGARARMAKRNADAWKPAAK